MTVADARSERMRRQARHKLLEQYADIGRSVQRILDRTELSDGQCEGLEMIRDGANKLRTALDD